MRELILGELTAEGVTNRFAAAPSAAFRGTVELTPQLGIQSHAQSSPTFSC